MDGVEIPRTPCSGVFLVEAGGVSYDIHVKSGERSARVDSRPLSSPAAGESWLRRRLEPRASRRACSLAALPPKTRRSSAPPAGGCRYALRPALPARHNLISTRPNWRGSRGGAEGARGGLWRGRPGREGGGGGLLFSLPESQPGGPPRPPGWAFRADPSPADRGHGRRRFPRRHAVSRARGLLLGSGGLAARASERASEGGWLEVGRLAGWGALRLARCVFSSPSAALKRYPGPLHE